ncbi:MAG TPA: GAF domain-containing protein [Cyanobacteria bacterium UBA8803]|nr:GAF domain-containing protein [Cyanobacteria bacterium UBA9273]HBL61792.1 GAF domain-containing protein [Cyanobacteria bacterium UBA8803]
MSQGQDFQEALAVVLKQICESSDWDYGEAWIPNQDGTILELSPAWCISSLQDSTAVFALEQFRQCSESFILRPGVGLPGRVWSSRQPEWITDASSESETYFLRNQIAKAFGVKAGFGLPIIANGEIVGVLIFFMLESRALDQNLVELTQTAAMQLLVRHKDYGTLTQE